MMRMNTTMGHFSRRVRKRRALLGADRFVTVGNYPASKRGSMAAPARSSAVLVEEARHLETLRAGDARPVGSASWRYRRAAIAGGSRQESWRTLFYANLISSFIGGPERRRDQRRDFGDGAWVQEVINAVEHSFRERRWVSLPFAP